MKLKPFIIALISIIAMFLAPFLTINYIFSGDALGIYFLLVFLFNPAVSFAIGIASGWKGKIEWYLPLINSVIYIISEIIIMGFNISTFIAAFIYAAIGLLAATITALIRKKIKKTV